MSELLKLAERERFLEALDFNGANSDDPLAAAYFRQSAILIRHLEGELDHWKQAARIERTNATNLRRDLAATRRQLDEARASQEARP